jgi:hypothetical protein
VWPIFGMPAHAYQSLISPASIIFTSSVADRVSLYAILIEGFAGPQRR